MCTTIKIACTHVFFVTIYKTMKRIKTMFCLLVAAAFAGCNTPEANFYPIDGHAEISYAQKDAKDVALFITKKPDAPYKELGILTYSLPYAVDDETKIYEILRRKAAQVGADAVIILAPQTSLSNTPNVYYDYWGTPTIVDNTLTNTTYRGVAIKIAQNKKAEK